MSSFVGREYDVASVTALLDHSRIVTLTGPPGVGKTRLGIQVARSVVGKFSGGAAWAELATVGDPAGMAEAVRAAVAPGTAPGDPVIDVADLVGERTMLMLLDNCERHASACAELADELLKRCGGLSVLATSQEALGIDGEHVWRVSPLDVPSVPYEDGPNVADSVRLFCERARAVNPDLVVDADDLSNVGEICRRLDGIPLAIELAAAGVAVLPVADIAARLTDPGNDPFSILVWGSRTAEARHRSLRGSLDSSWQDLPDSEQALLRRVSIFPAGFGLDTATELWADGGPGEGSASATHGTEVLHLVARLVAKSLVQTEPAPWGARYRLFGLVRRYATARLVEAGEETLAQELALMALARLFTAGEGALYGPEHETWLARWAVERSNVLAALEAIPPDEWSDVALEMVASLAMFWWLRGPPGEGRFWLQSAVDSSAAAGPALRTRILWGAALMAVMASDVDAALPWLEEGLRLAVGPSQAVTRSRTLLLMARCAAAGGDMDKAVDLIDDALVPARDAGDAWCVAECLTMQGWIWLRTDDSRAIAALQEGLAVARPTGEPKLTVEALNGLAFLGIRSGDLDTAESVLEEAIAASGTVPLLDGHAPALTLLGWVAITRAENRRARELLGAAMEQARAMGSDASMGLALSLMASLEFIDGNPVAARELYEEAQRLYPGGSESWTLVLGLAEAAEAADDGGVARTLTAEALSLARAADDSRGVARILYSVAKKARAEGDHKQAASAHHEALLMRVKIGNGGGVAESLEAVAGVAAEAHRWSQAARIFGSAQAVRDVGGHPRYPTEQDSYEADVALVRANMSAQEFETAWSEGAAQSQEEAVSYASRGRGRHRVGATGRERLTKTEREVAALAAEGLTNPEIGQRLYISYRTVQVHLSHVFRKLGVKSRVDLAKDPSLWAEP